MLIAVTAAMTVVPSSAHAGPVQPACSPGARITSAEHLGRVLAGMHMAGLDQRQTDERLASRYGLRSLTTNGEAPAASGDPSAQAVSTGADVSVRAPSIYRDTCTGRWYAAARYNWLTMSRFRSEWPAFCGNPCALSGYDGFGISFNRNLTGIGGSSMTTWGKSGYFPPSTGRTWRDTATASGVWFEGVDHFAGGLPGDDYDFYNGQLVLTILDPGCGPLYAIARYSHTWSNTTITGVSIGHLSIGLSWSSSGGRWGKSSGYSSTVHFC